MFHWICPECGGEIPPTVRECPICDPSAAPVELAPAAGVKRVAEQVSGAVLTVADPTVAVVNGKPAVGKTRLRITGPPVVPGAADKAIDVAPAAESAPPAVEDSGAEDSKVEVEGSQVSAGESRAKVEGWD